MSSGALLNEKQSRLNPIMPWAVLLLSLLFTAAASLLTMRLAADQVDQRFENMTAEVTNEVQRQLQLYEQLLRSTVAYLYASERVDRDEFKTYVKNLELARNWPGVQGIGFSVWVPPDRLARHEAKIRAEGFPDYAINPPGERSIYTAIKYLEPFDWRNRRAFGFDMYSNPERREAMDRARLEGVAATSGKITLVQETEDDVQSGFLTYLPVYRSRATPPTEAERASQFIGWIYAPFRAGDLMLQVLGQRWPTLDVSVYDGDAISDESRLFMRGTNLEQPSSLERVAGKTQITMQGRTWTLLFGAERAAIDSWQHSQVQWSVAALGGVLSVVFFLFMRRLVKAQAQTERQYWDSRAAAERVEADLSSARLGEDALLDALPLLMLVQEKPSEEVVKANAYTRRLLGLNRQQQSALLDSLKLQLQQKAGWGALGADTTQLDNIRVETLSGPRWFNIQQKVLANSGGEGARRALTVGIDATESVRLEQRFLLMFDRIPMALALVSDDGLVRIANPACGRLLQVEPVHLIGHSLAEFMDKAAPQIAQSVTQHAFQLSEDDIYSHLICLIPATADASALNPDRASAE